MREELPNNIQEEKLAKYFAGEASAEESREVEEWVSLSPENKNLLLQLRVVWIDTGQVKLQEKPVGRKYDVNTAWKKVKARKAKAEERKSSDKWVLKVAASIVVLFVIGFMIRSFLSGPEQLTYTAEASVSTLALPDGSSLIVNQHSSITYPEDFGNDERIVKLEGEAFFEVEHNPKQPFLVKAGPTTVKVLGTSFNIHMEEMRVTVLVETGKVLFSNGAEEITLSAGERGIFSFETQAMVKQDQQISSGADQFWRTKTLKFTGQKLPEVIRALEKAYGVPIRLKGENLSDCNLSVTFRNDSLENILDIIALTLNLEVERSEDEIILSGEGCI